MSAAPVPAPDRTMSDAPWRKAVRQLLRNPTAMIGLGALVLLTIVAIAAPWLAPHDPIRQNPLMFLKPPSAEHWLGTDQFGRDIFSRILYGSRISLRIGLVSVGIAIALGGFLGLVSGFYGGWLDQVISRFVDLLLAFPGILLALVIVSVIGPSLTNVMIAVGISATPTYARVVRGSVLAARENVYVEAAHALGAGERRILARHVLPNVAIPIVSVLGIQFTYLLGGSVYIEVVFAWPGLGSLLQSAIRDADFPLVQAITIFISLFAISIHLLTDLAYGLLDPRLRRA